MIGAKLLLKLISLILFAVAAIGIGGRFNLVAGGLFFWEVGDLVA